MKRGWLIIVLAWLLALNGWAQEPAKTSVAVYPLLRCRADSVFFLLTGYLDPRARSGERH